MPSEGTSPMTLLLNVGSQLMKPCSVTMHAKTRNPSVTATGVTASRAISKIGRYTGRPGASRTLDSSSGVG